MEHTLVNHQGVEIPSANPATVTSVINASPGVGEMSDLKVVLNLEHTYTGDLVLTLTGPTGASAKLVQQHGGPGDHFRGTQFHDSAATGIEEGSAPFRGSFRPAESFAVFDRTDPNGTWTLTIDDRAAADGGFLNFWCLNFTMKPLLNVAVDLEGFHWKMKQLGVVKSLRDGLIIDRCIQANGGYGNPEAVEKCLGLKPVGPGPMELPSRLFESSSLSLVEDLLMRMPEEDRLHISSSLLETQENLLTEVTQEIDAIGRAGSSQVLEDGLPEGA